MWKVIGAAVTGNSHLAAGRACEDAVGWHTGAGATCLAVADGAGSRPLSRHGSALAVQRALALVGDRPRGDLGDRLRLVFRDVRHEIDALAHADGNDVADYATTLAVAILTPEATAIGQIGDTIAVVGRENRYHTAAPPDHGEYVNETTFVTGDDALAQLRITEYGAADVDAVFLATDGLRFKILADPAAGTPYPPFFEDLTTYARSPDATPDAVGRFLTALDDQSGDDKTLVAAVRP
jgi:protein phosphatase 2C-like protein